MWDDLTMATSVVHRQHGASLLTCAASVTSFLVESSRVSISILLNWGWELVTATLMTRYYARSPDVVCGNVM